MNDEALQLRNQAKDSASNGQYLLASMYISQAIVLFAKLNDAKALRELKHLSIAYHKKADKEYKVLSSSVSIPREEIEKIINEFSHYKHIGRNFDSIAHSRMFLQDFNEIAQFAVDNTPISALFSQHSATDRNGHLVSYDDFDAYWQAEQYGIWQDYSTKMLPQIMYKMRNDDKFKVVSLLNYFKKGKHFDISELKKLQTVFESIQRDDYISALHVIVPTFETVLLRTSANLGIDTVALGRGSPTTNQRTLSTNLLLSDEFINVWGVDFCRQVNFVLFDRYGYSLRHKVAHGTILDKECNLYTFSAVLYLYLRLMAMVTVTPNLNNPPSVVPE